MLVRGERICQDKGMVQWHDPIGFLSGVTPALRRAFAVLDIETVADLLQTLPRRYEDFSSQKLLFECQEGDQVTVRVRVRRAQSAGGFGARRVKLLRVLVEDASGTASALFFNQPWLMKELTPDRDILLSGVIHVHEKYGRQLTRPAWRPAEQAAAEEGGITSLYSTSRSIPQKTYRRYIDRALRELAWPAQDPLPTALRPEGMIDWKDALIMVHQPKKMSDVERGRRRLAYQEALQYRLAFGMTAHELKMQGGIAIPFHEGFAKQFAASLPFPLTGDQKRAIWTALQEMEHPVPMRRLLQGDVGSGKTAVAAFLAAHVCRQGSSAVILAPTDILASQHAETIRRLYAAHQLPLLLLTRTQKRAYFNEKEEALTPKEADARAKAGGVVLIGTHALLQEKRVPRDVGLVVVDEQHRFGVEQRQFLASALRQDGLYPHFLSMTATPIPRSLALTLFGDLHVSSLKEKPAGRAPIRSYVCSGAKKHEAYAAVRAAATRGEVSFIVCPRIDASDTSGAASVQELYASLQRELLQGLRLGVVHGRLKPEEKEVVMKDLQEGRLDAVVATTVIEVGVNIPKATVMVVEGADRFGMAQLHQLRGRVGRSTLPSSCYFVTDTDGESYERLERVATLQDGFALAEEDFRRRGAGNLFGTEQSGVLPFRIVRWEDIGLFQEAATRAQALLERDPLLSEVPWVREEIFRTRDASHAE